MLTNNVIFNIYDLTAAFGETSLINFSEAFICRGVCIDTRQLEPGNIFVAMQGEKLDSHSLVGDAFARGAVAVVIEKDKFEELKPVLESRPYILVDNTLNALGKLANIHRRRFSIPIIAIGGSNGKTTTKELTAHVLSAKFHVLKTFENFNNQLGVPLMLLQLEPSFTAAVLELGTNEPGEIAILTAIAEPTHGLITNIGKEHLEKLIDLDGVEFEETFLYGYLVKRGSTAFINLDDERLGKYEKLIDKKFTYGSGENCQLRSVINLDDELHPNIKFTYENNDFSVNMKSNGIASALNATAASAVGLFFGLSPDEIKTQLESYEPVKGHGYGRMFLEKAGNIKIINDCYNANPESMSLALQSLNSIKSEGKKIAALGDMREMGEASAEAHKQVLETAINNADEIYITGSEMQAAYQNFANVKKIKYFVNKESLINKLLVELNDDDVLLVKGSRGMKMEAIVTAALEKFSK